VLVAGAVVAVGAIVGIVLAVGGSSSNGPGTPQLFPATPGESAPSLTPITPPTSIGEFQLQPDSGTTTTISQDIVLARYQRPGSIAQQLLLSLNRVLDQQAVQSFVTNETNQNRSLFAPGVTTQSVTSGSVSYTCLNGTASGSTPYPLVACVWQGSSLVFNLVAIGPGVDQQFVLNLAPLAQSGTTS
jgi:hypothetical protein